MSLKSVSEAFSAFVNAQPVYTAAISKPPIPFMAMEGATFPLATYRVSQREFASKDADTYELFLFLWFNDYDACVTLIDALTEIFKDNQNQYQWKLSDIDFDPELNLFNGIINLTITT